MGFVAIPMLVIRMKIMVERAVTKAHIIPTSGPRMPLMTWTQNYIVQSSCGGSTPESVPILTQTLIGTVR